MSEEHGILERWRGLRRHPAFQAAAVYLGASWALIQVADIFFPSIDLVRALGILLAAGFVVVVAVVWRVTEREARAARQTEGESEAGDGGTSPIRRRRRLAYAAAAVFLAVGGVFWWLRPNLLGAVAPDAQVIAVLPFNTSGPGVELLGEGMVDLLSTNLDGVGGIRTIDSRTVLHRWRQRATAGGLDLEGAFGVGRDVDAGSVLLGSVIVAAGEARLNGELYSVRGEKLAQAQVEGPADSVFALADRLGIGLLREVWIAREPVPNLRVSGITTDDVNAIRAYLQGMQFYRRSEWDSALAAFQRALEVDSTFALAHYRVSVTYGWGQSFAFAGAQRHARLAERYGERLPARERTLVTAYRLFEDGRVAAHDSMQMYVRQYPDDPEGWYLLGDVRFHARPILALDLDSLLAPFDRVLELDPSLAPALVHPLELTLQFDDSARYARYLSALRGVASPEVVERFSRAKLIWDEPERFAENAGQLFANRSLIDEVLYNLYRSETLSPLDAVAYLTDRKADPTLRDISRVETLVLLANTLASLGRLSEARTIYEELWSFTGPMQEAAYNWMFPVMAGLADSSYAAPVIESMADALDRQAGQPGADYGQMVYSLTRGDADRGRRLANRGLTADTAMPAFYAPLFRAALGWADILEGDTLSGIERLRSGLEEAGYGPGSVLGMNQPLRFALASATASHPETRSEGILRLRYGTWIPDIVRVPLSYLLLGQALEADGQRTEAAAAYNRFLRLWADADAELQPRVETARRALARLAAEGAN